MRLGSLVRVKHGVRKGRHGIVCEVNEKRRLFRAFWDDLGRDKPDTWRAWQYVDVVVAGTGADAEDLIKAAEVDWS